MMLLLEATRGWGLLECPALTSGKAVGAISCQGIAASMCACTAKGRPCFLTNCVNSPYFRAPLASTKERSTDPGTCGGSIINIAVCKQAAD